MRRVWDAAKGAARAGVETMAGDRAADRVVPPTGATVWLTVGVAAAMAFLAVFALALTLAAGDLAERWSDDLDRASTIRIVAPEAEADAQLEAVRQVLAQTPGLISTRVIDAEEQAELLAPWLGPGLDVDTLPLPRLVELVEGDDFDAESLRLRLAAETPAAVLDDHGRWRDPLVAAADRLRGYGWTALALIAGAMAAMVVLAAQSALSANARVIHVLRLVGARDVYAARAFTRRFTLRAAGGAALGTAAGMVAMALLPSGAEAGVLSGLGYGGASWLLPLLIPIFAGIVAFLATRQAALRTLARIP